MARPSSTGARRTTGSYARRAPIQPGARADGVVYRPRRPTTTPLYPVVQHHLETFLAESAEGDAEDWAVPSWVERDFRAYLRCGILAHGFARIRCDACGHERLLAFSCKGRGVCPPGCGGEMRILAFLTEPVTVRTILVHLELPHRPPPLTPARGPPQHDLLLDQTPAFDIAAPEPVPEYDFDQSLPETFDD